MKPLEFKKLFEDIAKKFGYEKAFGGWFKESVECIGVLELQKSNYGNYFELNIKIFIQGAFGNRYSRSKDLVKKDIGDFFTRQPGSFKEFFSLENSIGIERRRAMILELFEQFIEPLFKKVLTIKGIKYMDSIGEIQLLPAVKEEVDQLSSDTKIN